MFIMLRSFLLLSVGGYAFPEFKTFNGVLFWHLPKTNDRRVAGGSEVNLAEIRKSLEAMNTSGIQAQSRKQSEMESEEC